MPKISCLHHRLLGLLYQTFGHVREETEFRTHTTDTLKEMQDGIKEIRASIEGMKLKQIGSVPLSPETIAEAENVLTAAASRKSTIDPNIVKDLGVKFVDAAQNDPPAWNTALAFLNYKSFLNGLATRVPAGVIANNNLTTKYHKGIAPEGENRPTFSVPAGVSVPKEQAAKFDLIGVDQNKDSKEGNPLLIASGGGIVLDGMELKNMIFRGVHIVYRGGPLKMDNVYFENCVFDVTQERHGESFAATLLRSGPSTTLTAA